VHVVARRNAASSEWGIHVLHLDFDDVHDLFLADFADLGFVRLFGTGCNTCGLFQEDRRCRSLGDESEALVFVDGESPLEDIADCFWVAALNSLQKAMMLTPCWPRAGPTGGAGICCACGDLQFDLSYDFFSHI
jgi:hypothetical protein